MAEKVKKSDELKINVSFKQHEKDLYDFVKSQRSPSNYIKDAIEFFRMQMGIQGIQKPKAPQKEEPVDSKPEDLMEF